MYLTKLNLNFKANEDQDIPAVLPDVLPDDDMEVSFKNDKAY